MGATLDRPPRARHRTDAPAGDRLVRSGGRGRHRAPVDRHRVRRIVGLGAVTAVAVATLPVVEASRTAEVASDAWSRLAGSGSGSSAPSGDQGPVGDVGPSPGGGLHRDDGPPTVEQPSPPADEIGPPTRPEPTTTVPDQTVPDRAVPDEMLTEDYVVVWGDTLSSIGAEHRMSWRQVHEANADAIGPDPNLVVVGTVLRVQPS